MREIETMNRVMMIINHPVFVINLNKIIMRETDRKFCKHGYEHIYDVARIAYILNLENKAGLNKEVVYAASLLHDIGRALDGNHAINSQLIASEILESVDFSKDEKDEIIAAILDHRHENNEFDSKLGEILYSADKLSRRCFECEAYNECYWDEDMKNNKLIY